jgi:hypothetical protein
MIYWKRLGLMSPDMSLCQEMGMCLQVRLPFDSILYILVSSTQYFSINRLIGTGDGKKQGEACPDDIDFEEHDDYIEVNGVDIHKPFVEKPVDADDHNIAIYYPSSAGGGCKKLFRKVGDRSSEFYPEINEVRRDGSYIYEEFIETQGTDVKMCKFSACPT